MKRLLVATFCLLAFLPVNLNAQFAIPAEAPSFGGAIASSDTFVLSGYVGSNLNPVSRGPNFRIASGFFGAVRQTTSTVGIEHDAFNIPEDFHLEANYPNPFNPSTKIEYGIPEATKVRISVINSVGQEIAVLVDKELAAGTYLATWDARSSAGQALPSGIYFYHLSSPSFSETRKMIFLK